MISYAGKILNIDLSSGRISTDSINHDFARKYLGGNGFAAKLIYDSVPSGAEPFSPENIVVFSSGPLCGAGVWGAGRGHAASISPLTNIFADSNYGGDFASMLKRSGYDAIVVAGSAESPVYISISDGDVSIKDGRGLR